MSRPASYVIASFFAAAAAMSACHGSQPASTTGSPAAAPAAEQAAPSAAVPQVSPAPSVSGAPSTAAIGTALPDDLPPLPVTPFPVARPPEIVRAVFTFAARHPEVLSKVPCFCGCENRG